ncbi:hypothetical protein LI90_4358 (plasmid) [Carbonactinospora thermoautotrophica]|uniref:Uncharacterized protein n=1 Tax=Carbonactinospora thermoautotrophica TaxID=1469144 RepID=A0A132MHR6_9ACTN|nr:hypothetical protein [Carbonactinospora thermoautotrophica]KWW97386.1 hypothetical protein LI90_4358 [Carbonactinospora thermoautotrophica]
MMLALLRRLVPDPRSLWLSVVRTYAPILAGLIVAWAARVGVHLDDASALSVVTALGAGGYYLLARLVEQHWPAAGRWLLGAAQPPAYLPAGQDVLQPDD